MSFLFYSIRLSVVIALAAGSFFGVQAYVAANEEAAAVTVSKPDPIAEELARAAFTGTLSPIYATIKYTKAQLAVPSGMMKKHTKVAAGVKKHTKVARPRAIQVPMQIAYIPDGQIVR
jgi:hypothetical protein